MLLCIAASSGVPSGGYLLPDLCARLTKDTGKTHSVAPSLRDWAVYVRMKDPSPERVADRVARVLRAEWHETGATRVLRPLKAFGASDDEGFAKAWKKATAGSKDLVSIPPSILLEMRVGDQLRFSSDVPRDAVKVPRQADGKPVDLVLRHLMPGVYEIGNTQVEVHVNLSEAVKPLGERAGAKVVVPEEFRPMPRMGGASFSPVAKDRNPQVLIDRGSKLLDAVARAGEFDLVAAVPESLALAGFSLEQARDLKDTLQVLSSFLDLEIGKEEVLGRIKRFDFGAATQTDRKSMIALLRDPPFAFDTPSLAELDASQPELATLAMGPLMLLITLGFPVEATPHYPYDVRLYRSLTEGDWIALRRGTTLAHLNPRAQVVVRTLLLKSRGIMESPVNALEIRERASGDIPLALSESREAGVLFRYDKRVPEYINLLNVAAHRKWQGYVDSLATFQVVEKLQLTLSIDGLDVPFFRLEVPARASFVRYSALPEAMRKEIEAHMAGMSDQERSVPPPD